MPGLTVHQSIVITTVRVNEMTNSSVLQIGSAGIIKPASTVHNATEQKAGKQEGSSAKTATSQAMQNFSVPLPPPR
ncbi:spore germination protein GerPB [Aneurinibacillus sp. Ricciae_BoGa-3]|uniref:spore germination protein GerPB n=1 Tax=Aneurinibacillus sp. Ricciae_BoGa-3 TaxID=3022697 RepID=UPI00233FFBFB|nr:spore germination protein GerPB [Aneurinibacillus sp. Ricciae_BoGa-3]WCK55206.1 spore germination protein GerPB [Aneurinibacillus sp. Ricciae_BoGa-3]